MKLRWPRPLLFLAACGACSTNGADKTRSSAVDAAVTVVSAFAPSDDAGCRKGYNVRQEICVHEAFDEPDAAALAEMITGYKRGARAPLLRVDADAQNADKRDARQRLSALSPGALSSTRLRDAEAAKQKRLAALDAMLARLQQNASERPLKGTADAAAAQGTGESNRVPGAVGGVAGGSALPGATALAGAGTLAQKLEELKALVQRLPETDSQTLRDQLSRDGFTEDEMRALLPEAR